MNNMTDASAILSTPHGDITIKFFPELAPGHVANFVALAKAGFYDGSVFHRVIPGFMIQGGDPNTKDAGKKHAWGTGGSGKNLKAEFNAKSHKRGILSMARASDPNSASCQFFIVVADSAFLDREYTVFGEVVSGMEVADKIVAAPRDGRDCPRDPVKMSVKIVEA